MTIKIFTFKKKMELLTRLYNIEGYLEQATRAADFISDDNVHNQIVYCLKKATENLNEVLKES